MATSFTKSPMVHCLLPSFQRLGLILVLGLVAIACVLAWRLSRRPEAISASEAEHGISEVRAVLDVVGASPFGQSERGQVLTARLEDFLADGRLRFSPDLTAESILWDRAGEKPRIFIGVMQTPVRLVFPERERLARRLYHEALHAEKRSKVVCLEEECDAFTAAEEAAAALGGRESGSPVLRDGVPVWDWVNANYSELSSDPEYRPLGRSGSELARRAGKLESE